MTSEPPGPPNAVVRPADHGPWLAAAAALMRAYAQSVQSEAGPSLVHQGFEAELAALPGRYAFPAGGIWLAWPATPDSPVESWPSGPARGVIALRPLPEVGSGVAEVKRMFVAPDARGLGLGSALLRTLMAHASAQGYRRLVLDTSAGMHAAIRLYTASGFIPAARYNHDPMPDTLYFERAL